MKISINATEIEYVKPHFFDCNVGSGLASWQEPHFTPQVNQTCDVEVHILVTLKSERIIKSRHGTVPSISIEDKQSAAVTAIIANRDEDGMMHLRLAQDCLNMVESEPGTRLNVSDHHLIHSHTR